MDLLLVTFQKIALYFVSHPDYVHDKYFHDYLHCCFFDDNDFQNDRLDVFDHHGNDDCNLRYTEKPELRSLCYMYKLPYLSGLVFFFVVFLF